MTWSERLKLAWTTFKREALPLYGWTLIFSGVIFVLVVAIVIAVLAQLNWAFPQTTGGYGGSLSPGMPVPGIPPTMGINPYPGPFGFPNQNLFGSFGGPMSNFPNLLSAAERLGVTLLLFLIFTWLIGSAFYTGLFNLTAKAYREKATFKDFSFKGFSRILGWQGVLLLIKLLLLIIGLIVGFTLGHSQIALWAFLIIYVLLITGVTIFILPWLTTSSIYLLAHRKEGFRDALSGSWNFFQKHMGILWGYIGTVILIEIAILILSKISLVIAGLADLVVSPFIAVLAIVWVLSLESQLDPSTATAVPYFEAQTPIVNPPSPVHHTTEVAPQSVEPKIDLQKAAPWAPLPEDKSNFCPTCGKANTGTAYCPQCGTQL